MGEPAPSFSLVPSYPPPPFPLGSCCLCLCPQIFNPRSFWMPSSSLCEVVSSETALMCKVFSKEKTQAGLGSQATPALMFRSVPEWRRWRMEVVNDCGTVGKIFRNSMGYQQSRALPFLNGFSAPGPGAAAGSSSPGEHLGRYSNPILGGL